MGRGFPAVARPGSPLLGGTATFSPLHVVPISREGGRMNLETEPEGRVILSYDGTGTARLLFLLAVAFLGVAAYARFLERGADDRMIGSLAGFAICAIAGLALVERSRFDFDPRGCVITWRRRWGWSVREGTMAFDRVRAVAVQTPIGDHGVPSRRLALVLIEGGEIPLTVGYRSDVADEFPALAERVRGVLGLEQQIGLAGYLQQLVNAGQTLEAIKLIRERDDVSLEEAKHRLDELRDRRKSA